MKRAFIFTLAAAAATANPLTYPECGKWNFSVGLENGVETGQTYSHSDTPGRTHVSFSTAYKLSSTQTVGYGQWFYAQSRLSTSIGFAILAEDSDRAKKEDFFDGDWSLILPFRVSSRQRITLGPQLGIAIMRHTSRKILANGQAHEPYDVKYAAPLIGGILGMQPTQALGLRFGLNFQFPSVKKRSGVTTLGNWESLGICRHGIDAFVNVMYQVSKHLEITGTLEHKAYSIYEQQDTDSWYGTAGYFRTSGTLGVKWAF